MTKKRVGRIVLTLLLLLTTLAGLGFALAPTAVRWYIQREYPGVTVGRVDILWMDKKVVLYDVEVHREGIDAKLTKVTASRDTALVEGGDVDVTLSGVGGSSNPSKVKITATGLDVVVRKDDITATLHGMSLDLDKVCFETGVIEHPLAKADLVNGCALRDKSKVTADKVTVPITLPFSIPKVKSEQTLTATNVEVSLEKEVLTAKLISFGPFSFQEPKVRLTCLDEISVTSSKVEVNHPWISPDPVWFKDVGILAPESLKDGIGQVEIKIGTQVFHVNPEEESIEGEGLCSEWASALPKPLPEALTYAKDSFTGNLAFSLKVKPHPSLKLTNTCKYDCKASPIKEVKQPSFTYEVYNAKNVVVPRKTGPGTLGWVSVQDLPPHVSRAFILLEDPAFETHKGVLPKALEASLKLDLDGGEFVRGGSTITMQLAKNLWLRRHKTIGRKAQEALLTFALESCMPKMQIIELYLNVIEFGPDIYGIGAASRHYFKKPASALTPEESFYLASILPAPRKAPPPGNLSRARRIMKMLAKSGYISDLMFDDGSSVDTTGWDVSP